ncbi:MAG: cytochrome c biogenesis protein CcdA [Candidatus Adiutrix sp.]|nr:cytochrome c biogenesis protein CcdA [Candidatus Adiutrix sp.]
MNLGALFIEQVGFGAAFTAGLLAFFSPCVLPLIPAWLTLVSGLSLGEMNAEEPKSFGFPRLFAPTLLFVLGFSVVFCALGAAAGLAGAFLENYGRLLRYLAGALMIFFGLYLAGLLSPSFLTREIRADLRRRPLGLAGSFVVGLGFAAGWTPCVGPVLGGILALAAAEQSSGLGLRLLAVFSLGLGLPFLILSLSWGAAWKALSRLRPVLKWSGRVLGVLMIALGLLLIANRLNLTL